MAKKKSSTSPVIELSRYVFKTPREDEEFAFCRGWRDEGELPAILSLTPVLEHPDPAILERLEHECSLRDELESDWAARPLTLVRHEGRTMLIIRSGCGRRRSA
jgi:hypothetical protein